MIKIDGKKIARKIIEELKKKPAPKKILAAVFVGQDKSSAAFLKRKEVVAEKLGVEFRLYQLEESINERELEEVVKRISDDDRVGGVIIQLPLPEKFNREKILAVLDARKDVDGLTAGSPVEAPTVGVVKAILDDLGVKIENKTIIVVGRGLLVGKPIADWLAQEQFRTKNLNLKIADSKTKNLKEFLSDADLVITGVGKDGLIDPQWLKPGAGIIDFGFPPDFNIQHPASNIQHLSFYTPTPGGTGPILVAVLFRNFYQIIKW